MLRRWFPIAIVTAVVVAAVLVPTLASPQSDATPQDKPAVGKAPLLFNITSGRDNVHAVSMALGLADTAARQGREVTVFLNVGAPYFATKDLSADVKAADFPPVKKLLGDLIADGGKVLVCRHCAHVANVESESLIGGAIFADHADVLARLEPGTLALSY